jgi:tRNA(fMet)-specific endonuclease VapC
LGLVLDSTVFIAGERRGVTVLDVLEDVRKKLGDQEIVISAMTAAELVHGVWRAPRRNIRARREEFVEEVFSRIPVRSISLRIARIAGQIDALCRAKGIVVPTADLFIGSTALDLDYAVATGNLRHFRRVSDLRVIEFR